MQSQRPHCLSRTLLTVVASLDRRTRLILQSLPSDGAWREINLPRSRCSLPYIDVQSNLTCLNQDGQALRRVLDVARRRLNAHTVLDTDELRIHAPLDDRGMPDFLLESLRFPMGATRVERDAERDFLEVGVRQERHVALVRGDKLRLLVDDGDDALDQDIRAWATSLGYLPSSGDDSYATQTLLKRIDAPLDTRHLDQEAWALMTYLYAVDFLGVDGVAIEERQGAQEVMLKPDCLSGRDLMVLGQMLHPYVPDDLLSYLQPMPSAAAPVMH